ncbi:hypothetical protein [Sphingomonas trueperi]|uniref:hypothetical protein n=1 Tax=Sphingomonas trueperi TaxID=53317 RepID=UPI000F242DD6
MRIKTREGGSVYTSPIGVREMSNAPADGHSKGCRLPPEEGTVETVRLIPLSEDLIILQGLDPEKDIQVSLHSSARMKLLGSKLTDFDPLDPEVTPRIRSAVQRLLTLEGAGSEPITLTALDID